jgi:hypothetical protein
VNSHVILLRVLLYRNFICDNLKGIILKRILLVFLNHLIDCVSCKELSHIFNCILHHILMFLRISNQLRILQIYTCFISLDNYFRPLVRIGLVISIKQIAFLSDLQLKVFVSLFLRLCIKGILSLNTLQLHPTFRLQWAWWRWIFFSTSSLSAAFETDDGTFSVQKWLFFWAFAAVTLRTETLVMSICFLIQRTHIISNTFVFQLKNFPSRVFI